MENKWRKLQTLLIWLVSSPQISASLNDKTISEQTTEDDKKVGAHVDKCTCQGIKRGSTALF